MNIKTIISKIILLFFVLVIVFSCLACSTVQRIPKEYHPIDESPKILSSAKWIWADNDENNVWMNFRKTFDLTTIPIEAITEIAVENKYYMWINGTEVIYDGGSKRGYNKNDGFFDQIDIAPYLNIGENLIAIKAWFWGVKGDTGDLSKSYSNVPIEKAGLIFGSQIGDIKIVSDSSWVVIQDTAFKDDTKEQYNVSQPNYRIPEYNIYYDANDEIDKDWMDNNYSNLSNWSEVEVRGSYGEEPWNNLHINTLPLIKKLDLSDYLNSEVFIGHTTTKTESIKVEIPYHAQLTPYLKVSSSEKSVITILTETTILETAVRTTFVTSGDGEDEFESPAWINGQYVTYIIPVGVTILDLKYRESGYNTEMLGSFSIDDDFYNTLWIMAARTQYLCIRDNFMDTPARERAQWGGDATIQMRVLQYSMDTEANKLYKKMLKQKVNWVVSDWIETGSKIENVDANKYYNLLPTVVPITNELYELPAQEMAGIIGVWDYYQYTGDIDVLHIMYEKALNYLKVWSFYDSGLVKHKTGQGLIDWQDTGNRVDTEVSENAWYYWALSTIKNMGDEIGVDTSWETKTMKKLHSAYQQLWIKNVGYATSDNYIDDRGNALAVLSGLAPSKNYPVILNAILENTKASAYMETYVLEALFKMGYYNEALERMKARFSIMVDDNLAHGYTTLWEYFNNQGTKNHAWSAGPLYLLSKYIGGIRPTSIGYKTYEVVPNFSKTNNISVSTETVIGTISYTATLDNLGYNMSLTLPTNGIATIAIPKIGNRDTVSFNGNIVFLNGKKKNINNIYFLSNDSFYNYFTIIGGGSFNIVGN